MGIIDKIKEEAREIADRISGKESGKVEFKLLKEEVLPGEILPFEIKLIAHPDHQYKIRRISILLREKETTNLGISKTSTEERTAGMTKGGQLMTLVDFEEEFPIYGELLLQPGQTEIVEGEVIIPVDAEATFIGRAVSHEWEVELSIDVEDGVNVRGTRKVIVLPLPREENKEEQPAQVPAQEMAYARVSQQKPERIEGSPQSVSDLRLRAETTKPLSQEPGIPEGPEPLPYEPSPGEPLEPAEVPYEPRPDSPTVIPEPTGKEEREWEFPGPGVKKGPVRQSPEQPDIGRRDTPGGNRPLTDQDVEETVPMGAEESLEKTGESKIAGTAEIPSELFDEKLLEPVPMMKSEPVSEEKKNEAPRRHLKTVPQKTQSPQENMAPESVERGAPLDTGK